WWSSHLLRQLRVAQPSFVWPVCCSALCGRLPSSFPSPHQAILGILDLTDALEPTLHEDSGRGVAGRTRMGTDQTRSSLIEREGDECRRRLRGIAAPLVAGHDAVGDLDYPLLVGWPFEGGAADDQMAVPMDDGKAMHPRVCCLSGAESAEPSGRDF